LIHERAKLGKYEGLPRDLDNSEEELPAALPPGTGRPVPLQLKPGDAVLLHPDTAHAAAPNLDANTVRTMVYFRLRNARVYSSEMCRRMETAESVSDVFEDLPGVIPHLVSSSESDAKENSSSSSSSWKLVHQKLIVESEVQNEGNPKYDAS
jgi:hypothetical protein